MKLGSQKKKIAAGFFFIIIALVIIYFFQPYWAEIDVQKAKEQIASFGIFSPIIFILITILTVTLSPIPGFPFWFIGLALYGFPLVGFYILIGNLIGASLNFWIAKAFGRPAVIRLAGKKAMKKVDEISMEIGWQMLLITRLFVGQLFDLVSYAAGLTPMTFRTYFLITILGETPPLFLSLYLFDKAAGNIFLLGIVTVIGYILMLIPPATLYFKKRLSP